MGTPEEFPPGLAPGQAFAKRSFDLVVSLGGLMLLWWLIALCWVAASIDTKQNGFFTQRRVGRYAREFTVVKLRTMRPVDGVTTTATTALDPRITSTGSFLRRSKLDELPQLWNVLLGQMSFVGPRPDVLGFADRLVGDDRVVLSVRPGITGPATLHYRGEEAVLAGVDDPDAYNEQVIWPAKVRINREYVRNYRFSDDLRYIWRTLVG